MTSTAGSIGTLVSNINTSASVLNVTTGGGNANINTTGRLSLGSIQMPGGMLIVTNDTVVRVQNAMPNNVTPVITAPGKIFYGSPTITTLAPANVFTANAKNIVFSGPAITVNGDVDISALKIGYQSQAQPTSTEDVIDTGDCEYDFNEPEESLVVLP